jgi:hypothetical protein
MKWIIFATVAAIGGLAYWIYQDEMAWRRYAAAHHCLEVARHGNPPIFMLVPISTGKTVILIPEWVPQPDTVTFSCDGGQVIVRR